jgi:hypothetical protein
METALLETWAAMLKTLAILTKYVRGDRSRSTRYFKMLNVN